MPRTSPRCFCRFKGGQALCAFFRQICSKILQTSCCFSLAGSRADSAPGRPDLPLVDSLALRVRHVIESKVRAAGPEAEQMARQEI